MTPETAAHQAPSSLGFSRQEHWSGLPFPSPMHESEKSKWSRSVVSNPQWPHGLQPTRLLRPWDFPGKSTRVGCHCLLRLGSLYGIKTRETKSHGTSMSHSITGFLSLRWLGQVWVDLGRIFIQQWSRLYYKTSGFQISFYLLNPLFTWNLIKKLTLQMRQKEHWCGQEPSTMRLTFPPRGGSVEY